MKTITLSDSGWQNLYTLSGLSGSVIVTNHTSTPIFLAQSITQPSNGALEAFPLDPMSTSVVYDDSIPVWVRGVPSGPIVVQNLASTILPFTGVDLPHDVYTWDEENYRRLRVDTGQTSFFIERQFRGFFEFNLAAGATRYFKVDAAVNTVLWNVALSVDSGGVKLETLAGGVENGVWTPISLFPKNTMTTRPTPFYVGQNTVTTGGTFTGGTLIDVVRVVTSSSTAQQSTVGSVPFSERGVAPGIYQWKLTNISQSGSTTGVFNFFYEER